MTRAPARSPALCAAALALCAAALAAGCGQKGALYLPDRNTRVITRPAPQSPPAQGAGAAASSSSTTSSSSSSRSSSSR